MTRSCFAHNHMTPKEFGVYQYALAVSHTSGKFFFDGRGTASQFAGTKKDAVYPIVSRLEKMGWFMVLKASERNELGMWTPTEYQVLNHEDWEKTHAGQCRKPVAEPRQAPVGKLRQAPVAESQLTCLDSSTDVSANSNSRVAEPRHKYVKRIQKREESERKDCAAPVPESGQAQSTDPKTSLSPGPSGAKPSTEKISVNEAVNYIIKTALVRNSAAAFDGGSNKKLGDALKQIGLTTYAELDTVVEKALAGCDDFMLRNFGSRLAAQLVGSVQALRARKEIRKEKRQAARPVEEWRDALYELASDSDADLDEWLKENPYPGDNTHQNSYFIDEAKRHRASLIADRAQWLDEWHRHLQDDDCGWAWWVGEKKRGFSFIWLEEDTVVAEFEKEKARRAGEKANASAQDIAV